MQQLSVAEADPTSRCFDRTRQRQPREAFRHGFTSNTEQARELFVSELEAFGR